MEDSQILGFSGLRIFAAVLHQAATDILVSILRNSLLTIKYSFQQIVKPDVRLVYTSKYS